MGRIFPGSPGCSAPDEYRNGSYYILKPEYFRIDQNGDLELLTVSQRGCNGYSQANITDIKAHSEKIFVTVSGEQIPYMRKLLSSSIKRADAISKLLIFLDNNEIDG